MIQYAYTILYVPDVEATLDFYTKAFDLPRKFITPEKDYGELISGNTTIAFANTELARRNLPKGFREGVAHEEPFGIELGFVTTDVQESLDKAVAAGAEAYEEIVTKEWGQEVGYVRDINGFLIELCSPMPLKTPDGES